eukprot:Hpha_TRINITY_DN14869_c5_g7::TRINITY_DN14869_c5_g7_i1::g.169599::m.169599/K00021/HMGCR; hydroxymethylglutaryl-CoA reductase (NADPH)
MLRCLPRLVVGLQQGPAAPGHVHRAPAEAPDDLFIDMLRHKQVKVHELESVLLHDYTRAARIRRRFIEETMEAHLPQSGWAANLPLEGFDYGIAHTSNCDNIVGFTTVPLGVAGPVLMDGTPYPIPMATTEGALVANTHRGATVVSDAGGVHTRVLSNAMTRAVVIAARDLAEASVVSEWIHANQGSLRECFDASIPHGKLLGAEPRVVGRKVYLRLRYTAGDAIGTGVMSTGCECVVRKLLDVYPTVRVLGLSSTVNAAQNLLCESGKSVCAEAVLPKELVRSKLNTTAGSLVRAHLDNNLVDSFLAGSGGGFTTHAASTVAGIFLATGQDMGRVGGSHALTLLEETADGQLVVSVTMPSVEVGTVGGGTNLPAQRAACEMLGCKGAVPELQAGRDAKILARLVCSAVLCSELSSLAALAACAPPCSRRVPSQ